MLKVLRLGGAPVFCAAICARVRAGNRHGISRGRLSGQAVILVAVEPVVEHSPAAPQGRFSIAENVIGETNTWGRHEGLLVVRSKRHAANSQHLQSVGRVTRIGNVIAYESAG